MKPSARWLPICAALSLLAATLPVRAAGSGRLDPEEAKELLQRGQSLYDLGKYQEALDVFEGLYQRKNVPGLLYNIAQCHRMLGDLKKAKATYRAFLAKNPDPGRAKMVSDLLTEIDKALDAQSAAKDKNPVGLAPMPQPASPPEPVVTRAPAPAPAPRAVPEAAVAAAPPEPPARPRRWTWVAGGGAVVAGSAGLLFGLQSSSTGNQIKAGGHTGAEVATLNDQFKSQAQKANLLVGAGAVLAAVSVGLFIARF